MSEYVPRQVIETEMLPKAFDAVVVCGMGPVGIRETSPETQGLNLVATNLHNFHNALAGELLAAHGVTDKVIVSGFKSQTKTGPTVREQIERDTSEAQLLALTYTRAHLKGLNTEARARADAALVQEPDATTTFGNFIQALNKLDAQSRGLWNGTLGVVSSEFHGPRIAEMLTMFGVKGQFVSAERVMHRFGYKNVYPRDSKAWQDHEQATYNGQPQNYENLIRNPSYVTKYLAEVTSPRRLQEMAGSLRSYILAHDPEHLPDAFRELPRTFTSSFDYEALRKKFAGVSTEKKTFIEAPTVAAYRHLAHMVGNETASVLPK